MKNFVKWFGIIALVAIIGVSFAACDDGSGGGSNGQNPNGGTALSAPTGVSATGRNSSSIIVSWDTVAGATGYYIYRSSTSSGTYSMVMPVGSQSSWTNSGLPANTTYYYRVSAHDKNYNESALSSPVSATTMP